MATGNDAGRVPRTIECELTDELVDAGVPGDVVTVSGIVKVLNPDLEKSGIALLSLHPFFIPAKRYDT